MTQYADFYPTGPLDIGVGLLRTKYIYTIHVYVQANPTRHKVRRTLFLKLVPASITQTRCAYAVAVRLI